MGVAMKGLLVSVKALLGTLAHLALPILLAVGAIVTLKKMWDLNIGGIQTQVFGLAGAFRDTLGKAFVQFQKALQKLGPMIKVVIVPLFGVLKGLATVLGGLFDGVFAIIDPILDALNEIFAPLAEMMDELGIGIDGFKILSDILRVVGKTIGWVVKIALWPMLTAMRMGLKLGDKFGGSMNILKRHIEAMVAPFKMIYDMAVKVAQFLGLMKDDTEQASALPGNIQPSAVPVSNVQSGTQRTTNVQPNIVINTSREITERGARDFSTTLSSEITRQAGAY
jgi:hypothetical protein